MTKPVDFTSGAPARVRRVIKPPLDSWNLWVEAAEAAGVSCLAFICACCDSAAARILEHDDASE
jgi:hypothetical protein